LYPFLLKNFDSEYTLKDKNLVKLDGLCGDVPVLSQKMLLSCRTKQPSVIQNGGFQGAFLKDVILKNPSVLGNQSCIIGFPFNIRSVTANEDIPLRQSPSKETRKNKMWYIIDAKEDAVISYELKDLNGFTGEIQSCILKDGDIVFIPPETRYSIGKGITFVEFEFVLNDNLSEFYILSAEETFETAQDITIFPFGVVRNLSSENGFISDMLKFNGKAGLCEENSFLSVVVLSGSVSLSYSDGSMKIGEMQSVFVPAKTRIELLGTADIILSHI